MRHDIALTCSCAAFCHHFRSHSIFSHAHTSSNKLQVITNQQKHSVPSLSRNAMKHSTCIFNRHSYRHAGRSVNTRKLLPARTPNGGEMMTQIKTNAGSKYSNYIVLYIVYIGQCLQTILFLTNTVVVVETLIHGSFAGRFFVSLYILYIV